MAVRSIAPATPLAGLETPAPHIARRLLCLLPFPPRLDAVHGGGRATAQLLERLAARHRVAALYLRSPDEPPMDERLLGCCEVVEEIMRPEMASGWRQTLRAGWSVLGGTPLWVMDRAVASYAERVETLARTWQPDIVQLEYHVMGQYLEALHACPAPRVLTAYEPGTAAAADVWRSGQGAGRIMPLLDVLAWRRFERAVLSRVQAAVVFTERDRQALASLASSVPLVGIPLGTTLSAQPLDPLGREPFSLVFIGSFTHPPNVDAAWRLVQGIFPQVRAVYPQARLYVVGQAPPPPLRALANEAVVVTGRVPDVAPYLDRAALVVVPLRLGGGMRVKVLEALAAGKAVVASPRAVEGLDLRHGETVCLAETDEAFAAAIVSLLADPERRVRLAQQARAWAVDHLGWESSVLAYEALYTRLIASEGRL